MPSVGEILRNARLRQGLSLAQVETQTRIRLKFLDALESDRFDGIPGKFFVRSFSLQYGAKLGVDAAELQAALDRQLPSSESETQLAFPEKPITVPPLMADGVGPRAGDRRWVYSLAGLLAVLHEASSAVFLLRDGKAFAGAVPMGNVVRLAVLPAEQNGFAIHVAGEVKQSSVEVFHLHTGGLNLCKRVFEQLHGAFARFLALYGRGEIKIGSAREKHVVSDILNLLIDYGNGFFRLHGALKQRLKNGQQHSGFLRCESLI